MTPARRPVIPTRRQTLGAFAALALGLGSGRSGAAQSVPPPPARPTPPAPSPAPAAKPGPAQAAPNPRPGVAASGAVVEEIRTTLAHAVERFQARDLEGVLAYVSDAYWTGPFGKRGVRSQLVALYQVNQQVRAQVRLDEVRLVGAHAWVWTTGEVTGQLAVVGQWLGLFAWERELEIARREQGAWRLYGYQQ
jgi:hypothetical protein